MNLEDLGISSTCGEVFHDLEKGGAGALCCLGRRHAGPHSSIQRSPEQSEAVEKTNEQFMAFLSDLVSDMKSDEKPVERKEWVNGWEGLV